MDLSVSKGSATKNKTKIPPTWAKYNFVSCPEYYNKK